MKDFSFRKWNYI